MDENMVDWMKEFGLPGDKIKELVGKYGEEHVRAAAAAGLKGEDLKSGSFASFKYGPEHMVNAVEASLRGFDIHRGAYASSKHGPLAMLTAVEAGLTGWDIPTGAKLFAERKLVGLNLYKAVRAAKKR